MPEPTTPQLSESEVADIECVWIGGGEVSDERIGALIRDWRALSERLAFEAKWHDDHAEREAAVCPEDVPCDEYIRVLEKQNTALREQLAQLRNALEPLTMNGRLFTFHRNVEEGDYFECGICHREAKHWRGIQHTPECRIEIARQALEVKP